MTLVRAVVIRVVGDIGVGVVALYANEMK